MKSDSGSAPVPEAPTPLSYVSPKRPGRVYVRKFDHDEARRRYATGESMSDLATEFGVHQNAVRRVVSETYYESQVRWRAHYAASGRCDRCKGPMNGLSRYRGSRLCVSCSADDNATTVRPRTLRCVTCKEWKSDAEFASNRSNAGRRRGRHSECRSCGTKTRQDYRERHKVPCIGCGKRVLPPNEKRSQGSPFPRCKDCLYEWQRLPEQREAARKRSIAARQNGEEQVA